MLEQVICYSLNQFLDKNHSQNNSSKVLNHLSTTFQNFILLTEKKDKKEIEIMIWEIDDDLDGHVSWDEFLVMYYYFNFFFF